MSWSLLSDHLHGDPKFKRVPVEARWLFLCLYSWCRDHKTGGCLTRQDAIDVARYQGVAPRMVEKLTADLGHPFEHPFLVDEGSLLIIHDFEQYARLGEKEQKRRLGRPPATTPPPNAEAARKRERRAQRWEDENAPELRRNADVTPEYSGTRSHAREVPNPKPIPSPTTPTESLGSLDPSVGFPAPREIHRNGHQELPVQPGPRVDDGFTTPAASAARSYSKAAQLHRKASS